MSIIFRSKQGKSADLTDYPQLFSLFFQLSFIFLLYYAPKAENTFRKNRVGHTEAGLPTQPRGTCFLPGLPGSEVLAHHQRYLEDNGVVKLPQVKPRELLDLFQTVDQRIAVDEQLAGGLGDVQAVLKEHVDGEQRLLIERLDGILAEDLGEEDLAQRGRQLIDQAGRCQGFHN